jgi:hypothetical protein
MEFKAFTFGVESRKDTYNGQRVPAWVRREYNTSVPKVEYNKKKKVVNS